jgi:HK97 family phage prohead protease
MNNRAYSLLTVKDINQETRTISGVATTPNVDRVGDIIDPLGVKYQNPMPFLWQHDHEQPVGQCRFKKPTKDGIEFTAEFVHPDKVESATLKDRLQLAWDSITNSLVRAVSIGFRPIEYQFMDAGGIRFVETEVYELSAVTVPANAEALISEIKSMDAKLREQAGVPEPELIEIPSEPEEPAKTGKKAIVVRLGAADQGRSPPFVIRKINPVRERT